MELSTQGVALLVSLVSGWRVAALLRYKSSTIVFGCFCFTLMVPYFGQNWLERESLLGPLAGPCRLCLQVASKEAQSSSFHLFLEWSSAMYIQLSLALRLKCLLSTSILSPKLFLTACRNRMPAFWAFPISRTCNPLQVVLSALPLVVNSKILKCPAHSSHLPSVTS